MGRLDFLYRMELPHRATSMYIYLMDRANNDGECWSVILTIAKELKLSQSTVRRALRGLRKAGLLETEQRYHTKGGKSSRFIKSAIIDGIKIHLPLRGYYALLVTGAPCHDGRRR